QNIASLKPLLSERDMYVSDTCKYQGPLTDQQRFMSKENYACKSKRLKRQIKELELSISEIEQAIEGLIRSDATLAHQHKLLCSIDGVGKQVVVKMIVETNAFKDFKHARQFCSHAGVAPFRYDWGTSIRSKSKVSQRCGQKHKSTFTLGCIIGCHAKRGRRTASVLHPKSS
ncbi:hypothetical protein EZS27_031086, partial [termite gut metagenome]